MQFHIDIISDTVCPWCYIGYRRLQTAISQHRERNASDTFSIAWHPFQLNPNAPRGQVTDKSESYEQKLGKEQTQLVFQRLRSAAEGVGINFSFGGRTGNTLDSHRLIEFAGEKSTANSADSNSKLAPQTRVVEELFADYFEREKDITDHVVLVAAAGRAGLDETEVKEFLTSKSLAQEVQNQARENREEEINGVPHFSINGTFTVEGAQDPNAFLMLFNRLKKRQQNMSGSSL